MLGRRFNREILVLIGVLVVLIVVAAIWSGGLFLTEINIRNMLLRACIVGIVAVGQAITMMSGGIDLSVGGNLVLAACIGAGLMTPAMALNISPGNNPVPVAAATIIMLLVAVGIGTANGLAVSRLRLPALIATLAMWQITYGAAYQATTAGQHIAPLPESFGIFGRGYIGVAPVSVVIFILVVAAAYFILTQTTFGRSIYAIGGNEKSAWLSGIDVRKVRTLVYVISGLCAGIGSVVSLSRTLVGSAKMAAGLEMDSIAAVVVGGVSLFGGKGSMIGVLLGILILCVMNNTMTLMGVLPWYQNIIRGCVIVAAVTASSFRSK